jgi:hypothetical protein
MQLLFVAVCSSESAMPCASPGLCYTLPIFPVHCWCAGLFLSGVMSKHGSMGDVYYLGKAW